jgi:hypothetical protein
MFFAVVCLFVCFHIARCILADGLALNSSQWTFSIAVASLSIPLGALLRMIDLKEYQAPKIDNTERARQGWKYAKQVLTQVRRVVSSFGFLFDLLVFVVVVVVVVVVVAVVVVVWLVCFLSFSWFSIQSDVQVNVANAFKSTLADQANEGTSASSSTATSKGSPSKATDGDEERPNISKSLKKQKRRGSAQMTS